MRAVKVLTLALAFANYASAFAMDIYRLSAIRDDNFGQGAPLELSYEVRQLFRDESLVIQAELRLYADAV